MCRFRALSLGFFLPWASAQRRCSWRSKAIQCRLFVGLLKHLKPKDPRQIIKLIKPPFGAFSNAMFRGDKLSRMVRFTRSGRKLRLDEHINHPRDKGESAGSDRHQNDDTWSHDPFSPIVLFGSQDSQELCSSTSPCLGKLWACYYCPFSYPRRNLAISRPH